MESIKKINFYGEEYLIDNDSIEYGNDVNSPSGACFKGYAYKGNVKYVVTWYPLESWLEGNREDESEACNWSEYDHIEEVDSEN